jgi:magnesium transporter
MADSDSDVAPRASALVRAASEPDLPGLVDRFSDTDAETADVGTSAADRPAQSAPVLNDEPLDPVASFSRYMEVETGQLAHPEAEAEHEQEQEGGVIYPLQLVYAGPRQPSPPPLHLPTDATMMDAGTELYSPVVFPYASPSPPIPVPSSSPKCARGGDRAHGPAVVSGSPRSPSSWLGANRGSAYFERTDTSAPGGLKRSPTVSTAAEGERRSLEPSRRDSGGITENALKRAGSLEANPAGTDMSASARGDGARRFLGAPESVAAEHTRAGRDGLAGEQARHGYVDRRYKLKCIEIADDGSARERQMSRADIMLEARATLPTYAPSPKEIGKWLENPKDKSPDLREFKAHYGLRPASKKAMQKALKNYLRNSLQPRDIRQVDPAFSAKPALWVRHSALIVSLEGVRAIILHDKIFLFDPNSNVAQRASTVIRQSVTTTTDMQGDPHLPFEFKALEGIFIIGILGLEQEFNSMKPVIDQHLHALPNDLTTRMLEELRINKQKLHHFLARAHGVRDVLDKLLDEDEDMANMYLSEKHASPSQSRNVENHDEVEMLLEAYMQVIDELVNRADLLNNAIEDTEDLVMIHLDTLRNRLLSVDLALNIFGMAFAFGGCFSSVFGMNLLMPLDNPSKGNVSFLVVVLIIVGFAVVVPWVSLVALRKRGLFSIR